MHDNQTARTDSAAARQLITALALAYPVLAHIAAARDSPAWTVAAIAVLVFALLIPWLRQGRALAWASAAMLAAGCWWMTTTPLRVLPLYLPPVLIPALMGWVFGRTLLPGATPLIEQLIRLLQPPLSEPDRAVWPYARRLTAAWTLLFVVLTLSNLLLAALAEPGGLLLAAGYKPPLTVPRDWWSLFANCLAYLLVAALFVIEYAYRRYRFPQQPYRNMFDFLIRMAAVLPHLTGRGRT